MPSFRRQHHALQRNVQRAQNKDRRDIPGDAACDSADAGDLAYTVLNYTKLSRRIVAIGGNEKNTYISGIKVVRYKIIPMRLQAYSVRWPASFSVRESISLHPMHGLAMKRTR